MIGVDISDEHIANARRMSEALSAPAEWYCCDVLDAPALLDGSADLVYTGRGAIVWIHDLGAWARRSFRLLKPGGVLYLFDDHPITWLFEQYAEGLKYSGNDYFDTAEVSRGWSETYVGDLGMPIEMHAEKHERVWPLGSVITALLEAGLRLERFTEHREEYWNSMPNLDGAQRSRIPMSYSLTARRPGRA